MKINKELKGFKNLKWSYAEILNIKAPVDATAEVLATTTIEAMIQYGIRFGIAGFVLGATVTFGIMYWL